MRIPSLPLTVALAAAVSLVAAPAASAQSQSPSPVAERCLVAERSRVPPCALAPGISPAPARLLPRAPPRRRARRFPERRHVAERRRAPPAAVARRRVPPPRPAPPPRPPRQRRWPSPAASSRSRATPVPHRWRSARRAHRHHHHAAVPAFHRAQPDLDLDRRRHLQGRQAAGRQGLGHQVRGRRRLTGSWRSASSRPPAPASSGPRPTASPGSWSPRCPARPSRLPSPVRPASSSVAASRKPTARSIQVSGRWRPTARRWPYRSVATATCRGPGRDRQRRLARGREEAVKQGRRHLQDDAPPVVFHRLHHLDPSHRAWRGDLDQHAGEALAGTLLHDDHRERRRQQVRPSTLWSSPDGVAWQDVVESTESGVASVRGGGLAA